MFGEASFAIEKAMVGTSRRRFRLAYPVSLSSDFNNNGTVDAADYVLWRNGGTVDN